LTSGLSGCSDGALPSNVGRMQIGIDGVLVGHRTDEQAKTGCTVVRLPEGTVGSGEIRGGAPASREFALLDPTRSVQRLDAVVLSGGSAYGLAAGDGVMQALEAEGVGFELKDAIVPIVVGLSLFDLAIGDSTVRPDAAWGLDALIAASSDPATGPVGAGTGATVGKWRGREAVRRGGLGIHRVEQGALVVTAIVAVNAVGDIDDGSTAARVLGGDRVWPELDETDGLGDPNTVIGVVVTNAALDKVGCFLVAQGAHDGLARAVFPPHMRTDGDGFVAAATGDVDATVDEVRLAAVVATETAIRGAVAILPG